MKFHVIKVCRHKQIGTQTDFVLGYHGRKKNTFTSPLNMRFLATCDIYCRTTFEKIYFFCEKIHVLQNNCSEKVENFPESKQNGFRLEES